jgi:glycosyltransferase involved in cell wall biosynthesis
MRKVMVFPRDPNPYQELLHAGLKPSGFEALYVGELTGSHTLNIVLLPFEVVARRLAGCRYLHLHWVFPFAVPVAGRFALTRRMSQWWFRFFLLAARLSGVHVVWTVHNVLPHQQVFRDDVEARRALVRACSLVVSHSDATLAEVRRRFGTPRAAVVLPIGPYVLVTSEAEAARPLRDGRIHVVFVGKIARYKGIEDLLAAFSDDDVQRCARLTIAGACDDTALEQELRAYADRVGATTRFEYLPDDELHRVLGGADLVALPLRNAATSSTAVLALTAGVPVALPNDSALQPLPAAAVLRYDGTPSGLANVIVTTARLSASDRAAQRAAACTWARTLPSWQDIGHDLAGQFYALAGQPISTRLPTRLPTPRGEEP